MWQKVRAKFVERGWRRFVALLARRQAHVLFELPTSQSEGWQPAVGERLESISAETIAASQHLVALLLELNADNAAYIKDVERDRAIGLLVLVDGRVVHYGFVFKKNKTACLLGLPACTALIGNAFTVPDHRGRGVQGRSVHARAILARGAGFSGVSAETSVDNLSSQRGLEKAGMRRRGRIDMLVLCSCLVIRWRRPKGISVLGLCI